jgi:hypothetical protein
LPGNLIDSTALKEVLRLKNSVSTDTDLLIHRPYKIVHIEESTMIGGAPEEARY